MRRAFCPLLSSQNSLPRSGVPGVRTPLFVLWKKKLPLMQTILGTRWTLYIYWLTKHLFLHICTHLKAAGRVGGGLNRNIDVPNQNISKLVLSANYGSACVLKFATLSYCSMWPRLWLRFSLGGIRHCEQKTSQNFKHACTFSHSGVLKNRIPEIIPKCLPLC